MDFFREKKQAIPLEEIDHTPNFVNISVQDELTNTNNDAISMFFDTLNLNYNFNENKENVEKNENYNNKQILQHGYAKKLEKTILLKQMDDNYKMSIESQYNIDNKENINIDQEDDDEEASELVIKEEKKPKKITIKAFENSIGSVKHEEMHESLKNYKHFQDDKYVLKMPLYDEYFMQNRREFLDDIQDKLIKYLEQRKKGNSSEKNESCDGSSKEDGFHPLIHQDIVKEYLKSTNPYRGLLLFHGLGSGKTCTSIGLIESLKETSKKIIIMTPASLRKNYQTQMMFCGNELFRKTEKWEFVKYPQDETRETFIDQVHILTGLKLKYLKKKDGIYMIRKGNNSNYDRSQVNEKELSEQIELMMQNRFKFLSYNGITTKRYLVNYKNNDIQNNPFDHSVVIIDEGHNFVSRIMNKLNSKKTSVSTNIYNDLICAENCRVVVLSGTPLINYPCELGVLFNIIGGSHVVIQIQITHKNEKMKSISKVSEVLNSLNLIDHIDFKEINKMYIELKIVKNPYGFVKNPKTGKMKYDFERGNITNDELKIMIENKLIESGYSINKKNKNTIIKHKYKQFPDTESEFNTLFISSKNEFMRKDYFQNKIVGLVSYIGDKRELMPEIIVPEENELQNKYYKDKEIFIEEIPMTKTTLQGYAIARSIEKEMDGSYKKQSNKDNQTSSYQIFSRSACNFVFPPNIQRPYPKSKDKMNEDDLEIYEDKELSSLPDGKYEVDEPITKSERSRKYKEEIQNVLHQLHSAPHKYFESNIEKLVKKIEYQPEAQKYQIDMTQTPTNQLKSYSPKFHRILTNLLNNENNGLHMLYSNFRTLEGIGIFKNVLDYYGFTELRIKKEIAGTSIVYKLEFTNPYYTNISFTSTAGNSVKTLLGRKFYALYTGKENEEEKEMIRNIFNGSLDKIPPSLRDDIVQKFYYGDYEKISTKNNLYGDLIQLLIISASGAEGIDLKNVRTVHIMEPYWHPVRTEQVIGRARRICSHKDLKKDEQTVKVYMYILTHNASLLNSDFGEQFTGLKEVQDYDRKERRTISTDERLYLIMKRKKLLMEDFLQSLKISAIDCMINYDDKDKCFSFKINPPSIDYTKDKKDKTTIKKTNDNENSGIGENDE